MADKININSHWRACTFAFLCSFVAGEVRASEETTVADSTIEEIIVTATKRETALSDTPLSILALSNESLEARDVVHFNDLLDTTPSATFAQGFNPISAQLSFRGVPSVTNADSTVAVYVDDAPFSIVALANVPAPGMFDLERVEILRGPQGTLYGQSSMGGTMRLITGEPDATEFAGKFRGSFADASEGEESTNFDAMLNIPIVEDVLAARVVYSKADLGGWIDDPGEPAFFLGLFPINPNPSAPRNDINDSDSEDIRVKLKWTPNENVELDYFYWHSEQFVRNDNSVTSDRSSDLYQRVAGGFDNPWGAEFTLQSLSGSFDFGWGTLENSISRMDYDTSAQGKFGFLESDSAFPAESTSNEIRLTSNGDGDWNWLVGHYYFDGQGAYDQDQLFVFFGARQVGRTENNSKSHSIFGEVSRQFADGKWEVLLGARYFEDERTLVQTQTAFGFDSMLTDEFEIDSFNPRFNLSYRPNDDSLYYFNFAKGFRSGFFHNLANRADLPPFLPAGDVGVVRPDEVLSYELGSKWTLLEGAMSLEAALFYTEWDDAQLQPLTPAGGAATINAADAEILGLDMALAWATPVDGLTVNATVSLIDSEYTRTNPAVQAMADLYLGVGFQSTIAVGESVGAVPDTSATLGVDYIGPEFGDHGLKPFFNGTFSYRAEQNDLSGFPRESDAQTDLTLRLGIEKSESWALTLFGRNLLDERGVLASSYGNFWGIPRPREIGLAVEFEF